MRYLREKALVVNGVVKSVFDGFDVDPAAWPAQITIILYTHNSLLSQK
jgi:hypothetical protein